MNNYSYIDGQNLYISIKKEEGWLLDFSRLLIYLRDKYSVKKAIIFLGYLKKNSDVYTKLVDIGFDLIFKPLQYSDVGNIKGNCDADLVLNCVLEKDKYDKAVIITGDGDFYSLIKYLYEANKLEILFAPNRKSCARILRMASKEKIDYVSDFKEKLSR